MVHTLPRGTADARVLASPSFALISVLSLVGLACSAEAPNRGAPPNGGTGGGGIVSPGPTTTTDPPPIDLPKGGGMGTPGKAPERKCELCEDLPAAPIIVDGAPADAPTLFGDPSNMTAGSLCIAEPADGSLFPYNWLRPRIRWVGSSSVYEVRITTPRQKNALVAYTTKSEYYIPQTVWSGDEATMAQGLARNNYEEDITVTVRGVSGSGGGTPVGASVKFRSAANDAGGSMVYWANVQSQTEESPAAGDKAGWLMGFAVGDEGVVEALRVLDVQMSGRSYSAQQKPIACIGCHTSTPDGDAVAFTGFWPWMGALASVTEAGRGSVPAYVTPSGLTAIQQDWLGAWTFSRGQWANGNRIAVASYGAATLGWPQSDHNKTNRDNLIWMNLAAAEPASVPAQDWEVIQTWAPAATGKALGIIKRTGDNRAALMPDFSNAGTQIIYSSSSTSLDGRIGEINDTDIYSVPYASGAGGNATPVPGAAQPGVAEYYPNFSADDRFIAFNRIANVMGIRDTTKSHGFRNHLYYRPESEIWIVPNGAEVTADAGEVTASTAIRLKANDPDACGGKKSPGVLNSWAKFSPRVNTINEKTYYWLIFSSTRDTPNTQRAKITQEMYEPIETLYSRLYMAAFTVEAGKVKTYPAIYLWNQDEASNNLTPAWDDFQIPAVPPPEKPR